MYNSFLDKFNIDCIVVTKHIKLESRSTFSLKVCNCAQGKQRICINCLVFKDSGMYVNFFEKCLGCDIVSPLDVFFAKLDPAFMDSDLLQHKWNLVITQQERHIFGLHVICWIFQGFDLLKVDLLFFFS